MARKNVRFVSKPGDKCSNCGTLGHWANTCVKRKAGGYQKRRRYNRY